MHIILALAFLVTFEQTGTLTFTAPAAWKPRAPASLMRVAEFVVPKTAGDAEDAEVIVYFFGRMGGSVEANVERWLGQVRQDPANAAKNGNRSSFTVGPLKMTSVDVTGTYIAEIRPGSAERHNKPNFRMRAVVVETPKGPHFVKLTGPAATVRDASGPFDQFIKSLKFQ